VPNLLEAVRQLYDNDGGLPANPYFFLAPRMAAFQERHGLWALADDEVLRSVEQKTSVEVVDEALKLARVRQFPHAWGLKHLLALVDIEGGAGRGQGERDKSRSFESESMQPTGVWHLPRGRWTNWGRVNGRTAQ
jgi:hypothetical protein